ncbi:MAG TPA: ankyrin repeat domain-containing protein [Verrucomicrobiae bacterium]|jgi:ankyrin repeat protein|nr:ankyrin repeat domain-containing protein [Verrucomicrobiae bacterium]
MRLKSWMPVMVLLLAAMARGATNDLTGLLQQGLFEEEANRNLDAAISSYQSLANDFDKDRQLAATAIFRLGECYRKLGKTNEAVVQYQRIVKEFSDQPTLVNLSRQNLAGLNVAPKAEDKNASDAGLQDARANVAALQAQLQEIEKMSHDEQRVFVQQNYPNPVLTESMTQLVNAEQDLIKLGMDYTPDHPKYKTARELVDDLNAKINAQTDGVVRGLRDKLTTAQAKLNVLGGHQGDFTAGGGTQEAVTDDEEKEIRNIQAMIQNSPDLVNALNAQGETPLEDAAGKGQLVVAKYLLDHGAQVNGMGRNKETPLYRAANQGHKTMVELLLAHGADVNGGAGPNPLRQVVGEGYSGVAEVLLANKADVNLPDNSGQRALHVAARYGGDDLIPSLITHGAEVNAADKTGNTPLELAASAGKVAAAKILLASKAAVSAQNNQGYTPLHQAAMAGHAEMISLLLASGAAVDATNSDGTTPLLLAVVNEHLDVVRVLLAHKANPNHAGPSIKMTSESSFSPYSQSSPVRLAIKNPEILAALLDAGGSREDAGAALSSPLSAAVDQNEVDSLKLLLRHGANPNRRSADGNSPLNQVLKQHRDKRMLPLLLAAGADPNAVDSDGFAPLCETSDPEIVQWLLADKADPNASNTSGYTALMHAVVYAPEEVVKILLEKGADIDRQDTNGNTALHFAAYKWDTTMVAVLLEHKANPNIQNNAGFTPLDIAKDGVNGSIPYSMMNENSSNALLTGQAGQRASEVIVGLLTKAGGLANLPKRDRIEVRRASGVGTTLTKGSHDWNRYSLLELVAGNYGLLSQNTSGEWSSKEDWGRFTLWNASLPFPDFKNVVIYRRAVNSTKQITTNVNLEEILTTGDCSRDVWLQWGDTVEIPEADHPVDQHWDGLSDQEAASLIKCLSRQVTVKIKNESTTLKLAPTLDSVTNPSRPNGRWRLVRASFMLRSVLDNSKLLRVSSDLSRVKVTRHDSVTKKTMEWVVDCTDWKQSDLWLRDGDVIEVPEK